MIQQSHLWCSTLFGSILLASALTVTSCVVTGDEVLAPRRGDDVSPPAGDDAEPPSDGGDPSTSAGDPSQLEWLPVASVVDGDTFRVTLGAVEERVRLQGVDTPELHPDPAGSPPQPYAEAAQAFTTANIGTRVALEYDSHCSLGECSPKYGVCPQDACCGFYCRLLGYVQLADGSDLGASLLRAGLARTYNYCANVYVPPPCDGCAFGRVTCEQWEYYDQNPALCADSRHTDCGCEDYDRRVEYCAIEAQAQADGVGLWGSSP